MPRVYKNVTKFQLVQLSYPNFSNSIADISGYISAIVQVIEPYVGSTCVQSCLNVLTGTSAFTTTAVYEGGRTNSNGSPIYTTIQVPPGAYTGKSLVAELNKHSNKTPIFNMLSYTDFKNNFLITKDHLQIFNEPGDYHFSYITGQVSGNPSKEFMASHYYNNNVFDNIYEPNEGHALTTYYYPVLKEYLTSGIGGHTINRMGLSHERFYDSTVHNFLGLDSAFLQSTISTNIYALDMYRKHHTFEKRPVNKYSWSYDDKLKQFRTLHSELHPSLQADIKNSYSTFYINQLAANGLNHKGFNSLSNTYTQHNIVFNTLHTYVSTILGNVYGISNYKYNPLTPFLLTSDYNGNGSSDTLADIYLNGSSQTIPQHSTINGKSVLTSTIGAGFIPSFSGINITSNHFSSIYSSMTGYHSSKSLALSTISTVTNGTSAAHHTYVTTKYGSVLPPSYLTTKTYNSGAGLPVTFITNKSLYVSGEAVNDSDPSEDCTSICKRLIESFLTSYYSCLPTNSVINTLAYKLGVYNPTSISGLSITSTLGNFNSFGNFNILMQINTDQSFNNMDIAMNENYNRSNETTGQTKYIAAKILTSGLNSNDISQTVIQNPIIFDGTLGKLDKLTIRLLLDDESLTPLDLFFPFNLPFTNWDATFQIDEEVGMADKSNIFNQTPNVNITSSLRPI
jgi:hypothetical protein